MKKLLYRYKMEDLKPKSEKYSRKVQILAPQMVKLKVLELRYDNNNNLEYVDVIYDVAD